MTTPVLLARCPACGAKNRMPLARIGQTGKCGRCAAELPPREFFAEAPIAVDDRRFDLITRWSGRPVLVDFWAAWCAPCRQLAPTLEALARELAGRLLVVKVDTQEAPVLAARFGVQSIPTLVLLRSGIEVDRMAGALPLTAIRARVERFLS
ncbi:MAG: thioredoxin [Candidatus Eisenbacteria bacterium]|uniref:Thioredoxin n=1 Tax=Eiseniibacteriota bacterium TaxID=2212470 RepID=A0A938BQ60_UNCEI|nr:thioredoxin [Candidatus Eisenbacteria bacterium]